MSYEDITVPFPWGRQLYKLFMRQAQFVSHKYTTKMPPNVGGRGWSITRQFHARSHRNYTRLHLGQAGRARHLRADG